MNNQLPLPPETPRLTDRPGPKHPMVCQLCGGSNRAGFGNGLMRHSLSLWQEHDCHDKPEHRFIALCEDCACREINAHPRLYRRCQPNEPIPGTLEICIACHSRLGIYCTDRLAKANGGPGVAITIAPMLMAFVDGSKFRGRTLIWPEAGMACKERRI